MGNFNDYFYMNYTLLNEVDPPVCKFCRKSVMWESTPAGWRLFDKDGSLHQCHDPFQIVKDLERNDTRRNNRIARTAKTRS